LGFWERYRQEQIVVYSRLVRIYRSIEAKNYDPVMHQTGYAIGDPGTEGGHSLGTEDTARELVGGSGDVDVYVRTQVHQIDDRADQNLARTLKLQTRKNTGTWYDISDVLADWVSMEDNVNITHGNDCSERLTAPATGSWLGNNQGVCDTSETQGASFSWTTDTEEYVEILHSVSMIDANLSNGDTVEFRLVESDDTLLTSYGLYPTINWSVSGGFQAAWAAKANQVIQPGIISV
jgi:hypothetical protein